ncbi:MAG: hypothetical protein ACKVQB_12530 [Bacteroidia bacterium]
MKKIMLIVAFGAMGLVTMSSCSREHTCNCVETDAAGGQTTTKTVINGTKKKAQEECDRGDSNIPKKDCEISSL